MQNMAEIALKWLEYIDKYLLGVIDRHLYEEDFKFSSTHWYSEEEEKPNSILLLSNIHWVNGKRFQ
jgi:hypothetical protein